MLKPTDSNKMEWQSAVYILTHKIKSSCAWKDIKRETLLSHLWNDEAVRTLIRLWLQEHHNQMESKSISKAQKYKAAGNEAFSAKDYFASVKHYTNCISYAPTNSQELSLGLANRSAALFYLGRYNDCIKDIDFAIKLHYPKKLQYKILLRALKCHVRLGKKDLAVKIYSKLQKIIQNRDYVSSAEEAQILEKMEKEIQLNLNTTKPASTNCTEINNQLLEAKSEIVFQEKSVFPHASIAINREYNETSGWHVVANTFIKKNDILFVEKPVSFVVLNQNASDVLCQHCNCSTRDVPVSCLLCTHAFYCSETCLSEAMSAYHRWECPGGQMEIWKEIGIGHLALKVFLICSNTADETTVNEMQRLITNFDKLPLDDIVVYGIAAVMLTTYLAEYTDFFQTNNFKDSLMKDHLKDKLFISNFNTSANNMNQLYASYLLLEYILKLIANGHTITKVDSMLATDKEDVVATGIYPSASMMNHACEPNIINIFVDQYLIVRAARDIVEGEEIFNCYGPHYKCMTKKERQEILKRQYCFSCKCRHCIDPKMEYVNGKI